METEPQIVYQNVDPSPWLTEHIRERIAKLEQFHDRITSCRVVVALPHRSGRKGKQFHVSLDIVVPGGQIIVNRQPGDDDAHEDVLVAVRDAFNAAQRQLEDHTRKLEPHLTKDHPNKRRGTVVRLFADQGYGFIAAADGQEYFFRRESATGDDWQRMEVGTEVRFNEMHGEQGPHAVAVSLA